MRRTCGVFNTNTFEVVIVQHEDAVSLRGLYPLGALQNHCCVPNTRHHFDDQQRLHVSAALPIAAGEELTMSYTNLLWDTRNRRRFLQVTKHFSCNCSRCSDPLVRQRRDASPRSRSSHTILCFSLGIRVRAWSASLCQGELPRISSTLRSPQPRILLDLPQMPDQCKLQTGENI